MHQSEDTLHKTKLLKSQKVNISKLQQMFSLIKCLCGGKGENLSPRCDQAATDFIICRYVWLVSLIDILAVQRPNLCRWKTLIMLVPVWGRMTGLLMGKSKHIKDSQMILFFFNDSGFSQTDGGGWWGRLAARRRPKWNAIFSTISSGLIINSQYMCSATARLVIIQSGLCFSLVGTVLLQLTELSSGLRRIETVHQREN